MNSGKNAKEKFKLLKKGLIYAFFAENPDKTEKNKAQNKNPGKN